MLRVVTDVSVLGRNKGFKVFVQHTTALVFGHDIIKQLFVLHLFEGIKPDDGFELLIQFGRQFQLMLIWERKSVAGIDGAAVFQIIDIVGCYIAIDL